MGIIHLQMLQVLATCTSTSGGEDEEEKVLTGLVSSVEGDSGMHIGFGSTQEGTMGSLSRKCILFQRTGSGCSIKVHNPMSLFLA